MAFTSAAVAGALLSFNRSDDAGADNHFDVIIIGGSYGGLSAAMALGRSLRRVLIIDGGKPCNRSTPHSHNFLTRDGEAPGAIADKGRAQVLHYKTVQLVEDIAVKGSRSGALFAITTLSGKTFTGKKLLFATGLKDIMPPVAGFSDCWGVSILHCPYCHGYEVKGKKTGILANGEAAVHYAQLVTNLTTDLTIYTNEAATFTPEQQQLLARNNVRIVAGKIKALVHQQGHLEKIVLEDGASYPLHALYNRPAYEQHCHIPAELGCEFTDLGLIKVSSTQQTTIPGVYACGDNSSMRSVATAVYTGSMAGSGINMDLCAATFHSK
ncbi:NAD(P)/FAD-dependent oxidoreductase [Chitinophaga solisilvae]|uniref:NAD(P)/FAD-dependent oxidoreductase n=1 Tax=Chitinophaga solisilvae TaxID=1233460 RepID=UPI00136B57C8|nr:NAD(P)/FAD-dependent oxidoreductase [Chitinophaga solisilvae]